MYKNKKIFVLGMARSGYEVAKLLAPDNEVFITDMKEQDEAKVKELETLGVKFEVSVKADELLDDSYDLVIKNPGIKYTHDCVLKAKELGIPVVVALNMMDIVRKEGTTINIKEIPASINPISPSTGL